MYYSEEFVEEVRNRNDIVDVISGYVALKKKGSDYFGLCPFHNEKSASFSVSRDKQMYYCFGCGNGGNVFTFLMEYNNDSFVEAVEQLANRAGMDIPREERSKKDKRADDEKGKLRQMNKLAANYFYYLLKQDRGKRALEYLLNRGITMETIKKFGLGYADRYRDDLYRYLCSKGFHDQDLKDSGLVSIDERGAVDKFFNRVMFPILDVQNRVIGFGGRVMGDGTPKYLNSRETVLFEKSRNLYGLTYAKKARKPYFIVCEGYMDVITMHQAGFDNTVASLGTAFTSQHAMLVKRYVDEVILSYDSDTAGQNAALRAIPLLKEVGCRVKVLDLSPHKDPDEFIKALGREALQERLSKAISSFMFEIKVLSLKYNQQDPESRTTFQHTVAKKLATIEEALERKNYIDAIANAYFMSGRELEKLVEKYGRELPFQKEAKRQNELRQESRKKEKIDGGKEAQKLLLTWLVNEPSLFEKLKGMIDSNDFLEPAYHAAAILLFEQYEQEGKVTPAKIINQFENAKEQSEIASLFHTSLKVEPLPKDNEKVITDIVKKVKKNRIDYEMSHSNDIMTWQELIKEKANLQRLHISL